MKLHVTIDTTIAPPWAPDSQPTRCKVYAELIGYGVVYEGQWTTDCAAAHREARRML